jgi:hypothetical protein
MFTGVMDTPAGAEEKLPPPQAFSRIENAASGAYEQNFVRMRSYISNGKIECQLYITIIRSLHLYSAKQTGMSAAGLELGLCGSVLIRWRSCTGSTSRLSGKCAELSLVR